LELPELSVLHKPDKGRLTKSGTLGMDSMCAAPALPRSATPTVLLAPRTGSQLRVVRERRIRPECVGVEVVETRGSDTKSKPFLEVGKTCVEPTKLSLRDSVTAVLIAAEMTAGSATTAADGVLPLPLITAPTKVGVARTRL